MKEPDLISNMKDNHQANIDKLKQSIPSPSILAPKNDSSSKLFDLSQMKLTDRINVLKCNNQIKELHTVLRDR